jgi:15-cis-phytoene synthase
VNAEIVFALSSAAEPTHKALIALWSLDDALGRVLSTGREPMVGRIRLAWWREALERLDRDNPPAEPVLQAVAAELLARGVTGASLAAMEEGWSAILHEEPVQAAELDLYAARRGALLFTLAARLLGGAVDNVAPAGEAWALVDLARHSSERSDVDAALAAARARRLPRRWPKALHPLGMLAVLAARDLRRGPDQWEAPGAPPRTARMLRHRLTGW